MSPRAILFDLDDTLISAYGRPGDAWSEVTVMFAERLAPLLPGDAAKAIADYGQNFWSDAGRHKQWRRDLQAARRQIVAGAFAKLESAGKPVPKLDVAFDLADRFTRFRDEQMHLLDGALDLIAALRARGILLALITNGASTVQRGKLERFGLNDLFDHIQIEEEAGFGKPDPQAYHHALAALDVKAEDTWMVGDNYEWEVVAPQALGIGGVWFDPHGLGELPDHSVLPRHRIRALAELLALLPTLHTDKI